MRIKLLFSSLLFFLLVNPINADSWRDPSWREMLNESLVIALVEYQSTGEFRAKAKPLTFYKGSIDAKEIWIGGFSNRYGPIDKVKSGDQFIVFLNRYDNSPEHLEYWEKTVKEEPELREFYEALKAGNAYYVWTPTSGDLKVKGKKVQYDLIQTSYYRDQKFNSLSQFTQFLEASSASNQDSFHRNTLKKLKEEKGEYMQAQFILMLQLTGFSQYDPVYESFVNQANPPVNFALAQLLGQVKSPESRDLLVRLISDENAMVQGEAIRQLSDEDPDFIGPILLSKLGMAKDGGFGPSNIMDPVSNSIDGGKIELIKTLGALKYKPATESLLPLLTTDNEYLFGILIHTLDSLGSDGYVPYIIDHLQKGTKSLLYHISNMIVDKNLVVCLPAFKEFISSHNRNQHPGYDYTISTCCGLGHFEDQETIDFLLADASNFMSYKDSIDSNKQQEWYQKYIETFTDLKVKAARPLLNEMLLDWHGINEDFGKSPKLFEMKKALEDSLRIVFSNQFQNEDFELSGVMTFIQNSAEVVKGAQPITYFIIEAIVPKDDKSKEYVLRLSEALGIPEDRVFIKYSASYFFNGIEHRFSQKNSISHSPLYSYYDYIKALPDTRGLNFLKALEQSGYLTKEFDLRQLKKAIKATEEGLK